MQNNIVPEGSLWEIIGIESAGKHPTVKCRCACGNEKIIRRQHLLSGASKSCGCLRKRLTSIRTRSHGETDSKEYRAWKKMRSRCSCKTDKSYEYYGGSGICVTNEWDDYKIFKRDMGVSPSGTSLDRINPFLNYCKENCRWADATTQARNTRRSIRIGDEPIADVAERNGIKPHVARTRVTICGWDPLKAATFKVR